MENAAASISYSYPLGTQLSNEYLRTLPLDIHPQIPEDLAQAPVHHYFEWLQESFAEYRSAVSAALEEETFVGPLLAKGRMSEEAYVDMLDLEALSRPEADYWLEMGADGQLLAKFVFIPKPKRVAPVLRAAVRSTMERLRRVAAAAVPKPTPKPKVAKRKAPVAPTECLPIHPVSLDDKLPQAKTFLPAVLKVMGQLTGCTPRALVPSKAVYPLVLKELGIDPDNCPWQLKGKPSLHRNISYAYRNAKEDYPGKKNYFIKTADVGMWGLTKEGVVEASKYQDGKKVTLPPPPKVRSPETNQTMRWLSNLGEPFRQELIAFATYRFPRSANLSKIEDHISTFLLDLIDKDKIGGYMERHGHHPTQVNVLNWWLKNSITSQLRRDGREPVCITNQGASSETVRKAKEAGETKWAVAPIGTPEIYPAGHGEELLPQDFFGGNLEKEVASSMDIDLLLRTVEQKLDAFPDDAICKEVFQEIKTGCSPREAQKGLQLTSASMKSAMKQIRATTLKAQGELSWDTLGY